MSHAAVMKAAQGYETDMVRFLRDIIAIPGESTTERKVLQRIQKELKATKAYDKVWFDGLGNLLARIGKGPRIIAVDAHVDTVGVGNPEEWKHDPYKGKLENGIVYGRGAGDQRGAVPAMVYGGKILKEQGLLPKDFSLLLTFTVMEEDCDGLCWQYIVNEDKIRPEAVIVTDSTNAEIKRGQRGRMEIGVRAEGRSCHGSMPHKGDNAVYKIAKVISEVEKLNETLKDDAFLGKGTITVSYVDCQTPSMCAVPGGAYCHLDRRLTRGETKELALKQVNDIVKRLKLKGVSVFLPRYERASFTKLVYPTEHYFPTWCFEEDDPQIAAAAATYKGLYGKKPKIGRWTFSTNGVSIAGMFGIPCVGFGPAPEDVAHTVNDSVPVAHLVRCAAFYAAYPADYAAIKPKA